MKKKIAFFVAVLLLAVTILYSGLRIWESTVSYSEQNGKTAFVSKTVTVDGVEYFPRQDITVLMLLGIDQFGPVQASESYKNPGAADVVVLLILNDQDQTVSVLCLNRDTMLEMPVLGVGGKQAGTAVAQLALSHSYGNGLQESCENTRKAVSDFLNGITIDHYVSMNMDAISIANDAVGGVVVNVEDDFSAVDESIQMGEYRLTGDEALTFVRTRKDVGSQLNLSRMERQQEYMRGFFAALQQRLSEDTGAAADLYEQVEPYVVTDCSTTVLLDLVDRCDEYDLVEIVSPEGENRLGEEYYEFYANEEKLQELVLRLFFAEKK